MIPYGTQSISQKDIDQVIDVLKSKWLTQGPMVPKFEKIVAKYSNASYAVATNSATSSLHISCLALELKSGDIVWTSPNTFVASSNAALYCGAKVDFIDICPKTYNLDIDALEEKLILAKKENKIPKIVIAVHYAGQSCDMEKIFQLSKKFGFKIIEDASHAIGAKYKDFPVGSCKFSDITVFSFHPVKIITSGEGGMALTNNKDLYEKLYRLRSHGISSKEEFMFNMPAQELWNYQQIDLGFNYRMTDLHAAIGYSQMDRIDSFIKKRNDIAKKYNKELSIENLTLPYQCPKTKSSYHLYPLRVKNNLRNELYSFLLNSGVGVNLHYIPVYLQPFYKNLGFKRGHCIEAEKLFNEIISIPIFPDLRTKDQEFIVEQIKSFFSKV